MNEANRLIVGLTVLVTDEVDFQPRIVEILSLVRAGMLDKAEKLLLVYVQLGSVAPVNKMRAYQALSRIAWVNSMTADERRHIIEFIKSTNK